MGMVYLPIFIALTLMGIMGSRPIISPLTFGSSRPIMMCEADEKEMFYAKLDSLVDQYTSGHSLSWVTSMLLLALKELAMSYVLQVLGIRDQSCTTEFGIAMLEG